MALNKRERFLLVTTIGAVVVGGTYLLASPLTRSWRSINSELETRRKELGMVNSTIARKPGWQQEYDQLRASVRQGTERFNMTSDVLKKIEDVGTAAGVIIVSRRPLPVVDKEVYRELPVQCSIETTLDSLVKFLHALQTGSGLMNVEQLQVLPKPDNPTILRCEIQIRALAGQSEGGS